MVIWRFFNLRKVFKEKTETELKSLEWKDQIERCDIDP